MYGFIDSYWIGLKQLTAVHDTLKAEDFLLEQWPYVAPSVPGGKKITFYMGKEW